MTFFVNVNYRFKIDDSLDPKGVVIPALAMPEHQLSRRLESNKPSSNRKRGRAKHPHLQNRLLDPQLYLAGLDAGKTPSFCAVLASYPWFGVTELEEYDSGKQRQSEWRKQAKEVIGDHWLGAPPTEPEAIQNAAKACVDFQIRHAMWGIILPSPLTLDPASDYTVEAEWLDAGLQAVEALDPNGNLPVFATIAVSDLVTYPYSAPHQNPLLDVILDTVSAREITGVYLVVEQYLEADNRRHCESDRTLRSLLHLVHRFAYESNLEVGVNFIGAFGLVAQAAGASWWASNWYKSLHRVRLADKLGEGRSYPLFWSAPCALDIHLDKDFDVLASKDLSRIEDRTSFSHGLIDAAKQGKSSNDVPDWSYRQTNVTAAMNHYIESAINMDARFSQETAGPGKRDEIEDWLLQCDMTANWARNELPNPKTALDHPAAWLKAFRAYRRDHQV